MRKLFGTVILLMAVMITVAVSGMAPARADFTGRSWQVKTVTGKIARKCEYRYQSRLFYEIFESYCPSSIEVY